MRIVWNCNIISSGTLYNQSFLIECKLYSYLIGTTWYVSTFFRTFQFPKKSSPGVFGIAEYGSDISFLKFSTLGPLGLKIFKIFKKIFFSKKLRKNPFCDFALQAYFLLNFSVPFAPKAQCVTKNVCKELKNFKNECQIRDQGH